MKYQSELAARESLKENPPSTIVRVSLLVAVACMAIKLPLLFLPAQDDMASIYAYYLRGPGDDWAMVNLSLTRLAVVPLFGVVSGMGFPDFVAGQIAFLGLDFSMALLAAMLFKFINNQISTSFLTLLTLLACLHPGIFELQAFWIARLNLLLAQLILLAVVGAWFLYPVYRYASVFLGTLLITYCYPGSLNVALTIYVILYAHEVQSSNLRIIDHVVRALGLAAAVLVAMLVSNFTMRALEAMGLLWPNKFVLLPLSELAPKFWRGVARVGRQLYGALTYGSTELASRLLFSLLALSLLGAVLATVRYPVGRLRRAIALVLGLLGVGLVSLQLPSFPFIYEWYTPRTFLHVFFAVAGILCLAWSGIHVTAGATKLRDSAVAAAVIIALLANMLLSFSYVLMRARDVLAAQQFVALLAEARFDWKKPIVVNFGDWTRFTAWSPGVVGDLAPLLSATWSSSELVALVAGRARLPATPEMHADAGVVCRVDADLGIRARIADRGTYMALCL